MNRYEAYLATQASAYRISKDGYRIVTREEAIAEAATLPGLQTRVNLRVRWLNGWPPNTLFEARPEGLLRLM